MGRPCASGLIDFDYTEFYLIDRDTKQRRIYDGFPLNKEDFRPTLSDFFLNKNTDFTYKKLVFNKFSDVYGPMADRLGYIMSERLKDAIIENGIKGMTFRELDFEINFTQTL